MRFLITIASIFCFLCVTACNEKRTTEDIGTEHARSIVAIHYTLKFEESRHAAQVYGTVIDDHGLILAQDVMSETTPSDWIHDIKVYPFSDNTEGYNAKYLGLDDFTGFHYFRVEEAALSKLKSAFSFGTAEAHPFMPVWGISSLEYQQTYYLPFFNNAMVGTIEKNDVDMAICTQPVSSVGGPVFDEQSRFVGIVFNALVAGYDMELNNQLYSVGLKKRGIGEIFLLSSSLQKFIQKEPETTLGIPAPWLGIAGLQALPNEALRHLGYPDNSALVVSQIFKDSSADKAGLKKGDIILGLDNVNFPCFPKEDAVLSYLKLYIAKNKKIEDDLIIDILRDNKPMQLTATLAKALPKDRDMPRLYLRRIGASFKHFSYYDNLNAKLYSLENKGMVVQFVRSDSPAADADLLAADWVKEINGTAVESYEEGMDILRKIEENKTITSFLILIEREGETKLIRVKLD